MQIPAMKLRINDKEFETDGQGFLSNLDDWSEEFAEETAKRDGITLFVDHWELIWYFRDYYEENQTSPTMHSMVRSLGKTKGPRFHNQKDYEKHILWPLHIWKNKPRHRGLNSFSPTRNRVFQQNSPYPDVQELLSKATDSGVVVVWAIL